MRPSLRRGLIPLSTLVLLASSPQVGFADDPCTRTKHCAKTIELPTADDCEADGCTCAQEIDCWVRNAKPWNEWETIPAGHIHWNALAFHNRFLITRISPEGEAAFRRALDPTIPLEPLPRGTVLYKPTYKATDGAPDTPSRPANTNVAVKLGDSYCPSGNEINGSCQGGAWFWYEVDTEDYSSDSPGFSDYGKPSKCTSCHNAVQLEGDYMFTVSIARRYPPTKPACNAETSFPSVTCRLADLIAVIEDAPLTPHARKQLLRPTYKARALVARAERYNDNVEESHARKRLRRAARRVRRFRERIAGLSRWQRLLPDARDRLAADAADLESSMKALRKELP